MPHCSQSQLSFFPLFRRALTTQKRGGVTPWFNNGSSTWRRLGVHVYVISVTSLRRLHGHPKKRNAGKPRRAWAPSDGRVKSIANFRGVGTLASVVQNSKISQKFRVKCKNKPLEGETGRRPRVICPGQRQQRFEKRVCDELRARGEDNPRKIPVRVIILQFNSEGDQ